MLDGMGKPTLCILCKQGTRFSKFDPHYHVNFLSRVTDKEALGSTCMSVLVEFCSLDVKFVCI